ncbi:MAG: dTMP kinase [Clostridiales Family XIII bacterium]|jgi:dTMP kinase|nr:dTMP kinase [Clostridiales Family XIII bacterium]
MKDGLFISFEGIDGSGKSTQLDLFYDYLVVNGFNVVKTKEPGATLIGKKIKKILLDKKNINIAKETETLLYAADRAQHMEEIILPALTENKIILTDRFFDSNLAYQSANDTENSDIKKANYFLKRNPDMTFYLRVDPKLAAKRIARKKQDRIEGKGIIFQEKVATIYDKIFSEKKEAIVIEAAGDKKKIFERIKSEFEKRL